jgi:hypothetical protein
VSTATPARGNDPAEDSRPGTKGGAFTSSVCLRLKLDTSLASSCWLVLPLLLVRQLRGSDPAAAAGGAAPAAGWAAFKLPLLLPQLAGGPDVPPAPTPLLLLPALLLLPSPALLLVLPSLALLLRVLL